MFSDKDLRAIRDAGYAVSEHADVEDLSDEMLLAMLKQATALFVARGGTLSPEQFEGLLRGIRDAPERMPGTLATAIRRHSTSQGARIVLLEESNERATSILVAIGSLVGLRDSEPTLDAVRRKIDGLRAEVQANWQTAMGASTPADAACLVADARQERDEARAELARLKPSGQVAEDVKRIRQILGDGVTWVAEREKFATIAEFDAIAAMAQGYEAAINGCSAARWGGTMCGHCSACVAYWETEASIQAANYERAKGERDAAVADNAELYDALDRMWRHIPHAHFNAAGVKALLDAPHPGAARLERTNKARALREDLLRERENAGHGGDERRYAHLSQRIADLTLTLGDH